MQLYTYDGLLYFFVEGSLIWFSFYCIVCLLFRFLPRNKIRQEAVNIQAATNLAIAIVAIIETVLWILILYYIYNENANDEKLIVVEYRFPYTLIMAGIVLFLITGLLFFIPKLRKSWLLSLLALIFINTDYLYSLLLDIWRDYHPSEWEFEGRSWVMRVIQFFGFTFFVFLLYFLLHRRKKLPYPSAWLR